MEATGSTNDDLRQALTGPNGYLDPAGAATWPHMSVLRAQHQTQGRGRGQNRWDTPARGALTASVVLRPLVPAHQLGWLPLVAGLALRDALAPLLAPTAWSARTKWPNDVVAQPREPGGQVRRVPDWGATRKLAGILTELIAPGPHLQEHSPATRDQACAVVLGLGVNVAQPPDQLPVPWAASLASLGAGSGPEQVAQVLEQAGHALARRLGQWEAAQGDPEAQGATLGKDLRQACLTLGQQVVVTSPGQDGPVKGLAVDLAPALVVEDEQGVRRSVAAGEVLSVRHSSVIWDTLAR